MADMPPLASVFDLEARLKGGIAEADVTRAEALLADASALVRAETTPTLWADAEDIPPDVVRVVCASAKRAFLNPSGLESESVGEWTGRRPDTERLSEDVYLKPEERRSVRRAAQLTSAGSVVLESPFGPGVATEYLAVDPAGEPIPWSDQ